MRKILIILLAVFLIGLVACDSNTSVNDSKFTSDEDYKAWTMEKLKLLMDDNEQINKYAQLDDMTSLRNVTTLAAKMERDCEAAIIEIDNLNPRPEWEEHQTNFRTALDFYQKSAQLIKEAYPTVDRVKIAAAQIYEDTAIEHIEAAGKAIPSNFMMPLLALPFPLSHP